MRNYSANRKKPGTVRMIRWIIAIGAVCGMMVLAVIYQRELRDLAVDDTRYEAEIKRAAANYHLDWQLVRALIFRESRFDADCVGNAGEIGLMQVLPEGAVAEWARARRFTPPTVRELRRPTVNLEIGCYYLARAMRRWEGHKDQKALALCQYNAGESRANRWRPDTPDGSMRNNITIRSTRDYVDYILNRYERYCKETKL